MWVVFKKSDKQVIGLSALSEIEMAKDQALKEVIKGLAEPGKLKDYDLIQVEDRARAEEVMQAFPHRLVIKGRRDQLRVVVEEPEAYGLSLISDAPDVHPVDGIPEIKADGKSFTTITVQKISQEGKPLRRDADNDQLYLRTDHGILHSADGKEEINSVKLKRGKASFHLTSEKNKRVATVQVISADPDLADTNIRIEFI